MKETKNLKLKKPGYADPVDINIINKNMDAIDLAVSKKAGEKELEELKAELEKNIVSPYSIGFEPPKSTDIFWIDLNEVPPTEDWEEIKKVLEEGE